mgnify:CR=1 FL=1
MLLTTCSKITHNFHINSSSGIQKDYISIPATNLLFARTGQYITETQQYVYCLPVISLTYNLGGEFLCGFDFKYINNRTEITTQSY